MTLQRALAYLEKLPPAISGSGGHNATLRAACECVRFGLSEGEAWEALQWFNAHRCQPAWTERELRHKLADAQKIVAASGQAGVMAARPMRHKAAQQWRPPTAPAALRLTYASKVARPQTSASAQGAILPKGDSPSQPEAPHAAQVARPARYNLWELPEVRNRLGVRVIGARNEADGLVLEVAPVAIPQTGELPDREGKVAIPQPPDDDPDRWAFIFAEESAALAFAEEESCQTVTGASARV